MLPIPSGRTVHLPLNLSSRLAAAWDDHSDVRFRTEFCNSIQQHGNQDRSASGIYMMLLSACNQYTARSIPTNSVKMHNRMSDLIAAIIDDTEMVEEVTTLWKNHGKRPPAKE